MIHLSKPLILASASPRRRELLAQAGLIFAVEAADVDENIELGSPAELVEELSRRKAGAVADIHPEAVVIGADTVVSIDGRILGKPANEADALRMLMSLAGRTHEVYTGVTVTDGRRTVTFSECTEVEMLGHDEAFLRRYIATKEPMDKAGAYGIQGIGALLVKGIRGDYNNVVGLPLTRTCLLLDELENGAEA